MDRLSLKPGVRRVVVGRLAGALGLGAGRLLGGIAEEAVRAGVGISYRGREIPGLRPILEATRGQTFRRVLALFLRRTRELILHQTQGSFRLRIR